MYFAVSSQDRIRFNLQSQRTYTTEASRAKNEVTLDDLAIKSDMNPNQILEILIRDVIISKGS